MVVLKNLIARKLCPLLGSKVLTQANEEVPVIVQFNDNEKFKNKISSLSEGYKQELPLINSYAGYMPTQLINEIINEPEIDYISYDSKVYTLLDIASPTIEAYFPHDKGYMGEGVTLAVIDTGLAMHSDLVKPNNRIVGFKDLVNDIKEPYDDNGHGTHVAGIIAGNGFSSDGKYKGVAPEASILSIKAMDENGGAPTSRIIEAISYAIDTKDDYNTKIINLSLGAPANSPSNKDPLCKAVEKAVKAGIVVVAAAGNSGPKEKTILTPGISHNIITVGAIDDKRTIDLTDDTIAPFSSRGPTLEGIMKPDLLAPGVNINSLSNSNLNEYSSLSGTSMATPLVSGAVALLLNKDPQLEPGEIKDKIINSCLDMDESKQIQGAGLLNLNLLFSDNEKDVEKDIDKHISPDDYRQDILESIFILLIILFLLDSKK